MKYFISASLLSILTLLLVSWKGIKEGVISEGSEPEVSLDSKGVIRAVFGRSDSIFYVSSTDKGIHISHPLFIEHIPQMHLGNTRGPLIAASDKYSIITAMDQKGDIHWFLLDNSKGKIVKKGNINDQRASAPEGLIGISADDRDHFYAVWLDCRINKRNNIFFSDFSARDAKWSVNKLVYRSPDGHTCECCKPNIAVHKEHVAIMFRNWLNGSRDLYFIESFNKGDSFDKP